MKKISLYLEYIYIWLALVTLLLGFVVGVLFLLSLAAGGSVGESLAVWAGTLMNWGIKLAALAILFGIVFIYVKKEHSLTIGAEQLQAAKQKSETSF